MIVRVMCNDCGMYMTTTSINMAIWAKECHTLDFEHFNIGITRYELQEQEC